MNYVSQDPCGMVPSPPSNDTLPGAVVQIKTCMERMQKTLAMSREARLKIEALLDPRPRPEPRPEAGVAQQAKMAQEPQGLIAYGQSLQRIISDVEEELHRIHAVL